MQGFLKSKKNILSSYIRTPTEQDDILYLYADEKVRDLQLDYDNLEISRKNSLAVVF